MQAHRTETTVAGDGSVTVHDLPFPEGEAVEVIVLPRQRHGESTSERPMLLGSALSFDRPFEPAADVDDWETA